MESTAPLSGPIILSPRYRRLESRQPRTLSLSGIKRIRPPQLRLAFLCVSCTKYRIKANSIDLEQIKITYPVQLYCQVIIVYSISKRHLFRCYQAKQLLLSIRSALFPSNASSARALDDSSFNSRLYEIVSTHNANAIFQLPRDQRSLYWNDCLTKSLSFRDIRVSKKKTFYCYIDNLGESRVYRT